jgi:hypothetical protein
VHWRFACPTFQLSKAALMDRGQIGQADPSIATARHSA